MCKVGDRELPRSGLLEPVVAPDTAKRRAGELNVGLARGTGEVVTCTKIKKALKGIKALYETHTPTDTSRRL
jgi:hypothetical protein